jgi:uncharacterized SAM-binding protein YcdF (DUF218 family)
MIRRTVALLVLAWLLGFGWFALALPLAQGGGKSDAVVVLTGGGGRIQRGLAALETGWAPRLFVSGVDREVRPREFAAEYRVPTRLMTCCVALGFQSFDTRSNAEEVADWLAKNKRKSVRLVTSDWHMRRAALELERRLPEGFPIIRDAVPTQPTFRILFLEYHKLLAAYVYGLWEGNA